MSTLTIVAIRRGDCVRVTVLRGRDCVFFTSLGQGDLLRAYSGHPLSSSERRQVTSAVSRAWQEGEAA